MKSYKSKKLELSQSKVKFLFDRYQSKQKISYEDFLKICRDLRIIPELISNQDLRQLCAKVISFPSKLMLSFFNFEQMLKLIASSIPHGTERVREQIRLFAFDSDKYENSENKLSKQTLKIVDIGLRSASLLPRHKSPKIRTHKSTARIHTSGNTHKLSALVNLKNKSNSPTTPSKKNDSVLKKHFRSLSNGFAPPNAPINPAFSQKKNSNNDLTCKVKEAYSRFIHKHNKIVTGAPKSNKSEKINAKCCRFMKGNSFPKRFVMRLIFNAWNGLIARRVK